MEAWSPAWSTFWAKTPNKTPAIVWTYLELSQDLSGQGDPDRRTLWQMLLKAFAWPKGVVSFWPMSEHQPAGFTPRPDMFWEGVRRLNPQHVACFGLEAFRALAPEADPNLHAQPYKDILLYHLPDPKTLSLASPPKRMHLVHALQTLAFSA